MSLFSSSRILLLGVVCCRIGRSIYFSTCKIQCGYLGDFFLKNRPHPAHFVQLSSGKKFSTSISFLPKWIWVVMAELAPQNVGPMLVLAVVARPIYAGKGEGTSPRGRCHPLVLANICHPRLWVKRPMGRCHTNMSPPKLSCSRQHFS